MVLVYNEVPHPNFALIADFKNVGHIHPPKCQHVFVLNYQSASHQLLHYQSMPVIAEEHQNRSEDQFAIYHSTFLHSHAFVVFLLQSGSPHFQKAAKDMNNSLA